MARIRRDPFGDSQSTPPRRSQWSRERRLTFIDYRALWEGRINRTDLEEMFSISAAQASLDIRAYMEIAPGNLIYDPRVKTYVASPMFKPSIVADDAEVYLREVLARALEVGPAEAPADLGWLPPCDVVRAPFRRVAASTLRTVLRAIRANERLEVLYQSMNSPEPTRREISPHAIANDGLRWHVRAYCHRREKFVDFVIGRLVDACFVAPSDIAPDADREWLTMTKLVIAAHPQLKVGQRKAIELEYGMENGVAEIRVREALVQYAIRRFRLDRVDSEVAPGAVQVVLVNRAELEHLLPTGKSEK